MKKFKLCSVLAAVFLLVSCSLPEDSSDKGDMGNSGVIQTTELKEKPEDKEQYTDFMIDIPAQFLSADAIYNNGNLVAVSGTAESESSECKYMVYDIETKTETKIIIPEDVNVIYDTSVCMYENKLYISYETKEQKKYISAFDCETGELVSSVLLDDDRQVTEIFADDGKIGVLFENPYISSINNQNFFAFYSEGLNRLSDYDIAGNLMLKDEENIAKVMPDGTGGYYILVNSMIYFYSDSYEEKSCSKLYRATSDFQIKSIYEMNNDASEKVNDFTVGRNGNVYLVVSRGCTNRVVEIDSQTGRFSLETIIDNMHHVYLGNDDYDFMYTTNNDNIVYGFSIKDGMKVSVADTGYISGVISSVYGTDKIIFGSENSDSSYRYSVYTADLESGEKYLSYLKPHKKNGIIEKICISDDGLIYGLEGSESYYGLNGNIVSEKKYFVNTYDMDGNVISSFPLALKGQDLVFDSFKVDKDGKIYTAAIVDSSLCKYFIFEKSGLVSAEYDINRENFNFSSIIESEGNIVLALYSSKDIKICYQNETREMSFYKMHTDEDVVSVCSGTDGALFYYRTVSAVYGCYTDEHIVKKLFDGCVHNENAEFIMPLNSQKIMSYSLVSDKNKLVISELKQNNK